MQELTFHFNKKKVEFVNFFSGILQVIQKLAHDIQLQIDREYHQTVAEFRQLQVDKISDACSRMEQERGKIYHQMIDRLYGTLKSFANQIGGKSIFGDGIKPHVQSIKNQLIGKSPQVTQKASNMIFSSQIQRAASEPIEMIRSTSQFNSSSQTVKLDSQLYPTKAPIIQVPINPKPSPFAQKRKQNLLKESQISNNESPTTQRTKQKIEIMKKTDVCESLDNYLNKEAKEMLQRSLSKQNSYSSLRRSLTKKYDTPERNKFHQHYENSGSNVEKRIGQKLGGINDSSGKYSTVGIIRKLPAQSMISPIQRYKLD